MFIDWQVASPESLDLWLFLQRIPLERGNFAEAVGVVWQRSTLA